ncbi:MAG: DUF1573 domain-containing protein [Pirellulaceae bacterium]
MIRSYLLSVMLCFVGLGMASAQQWATKMFKITNHDFGQVAAGAKAEASFELQNIYQEDVHIAMVRSSCGCTTPRIVQDTLKTWEKSAVIAAFNTHSFRGQRSATITVVIDKPYYAEVQLHVSGYIRGDIVLEPGEVNFGDVELAQGSEKKVRIQYFGRSDWRIADVRSANKNFEVELAEASRGGGQVAYDMVVRLRPEFPAGHFQDQLSLVTSDSQSRSVPVMVQGNIVAPVSVSPAALFLGVLEPGQSVTKNLVVKGKQAFHVECIDCADTAQLEFKKPDPTDNKSVYVIPVTFTAGDKPGPFSQKITIKTSYGGGLECCCVATASVRAPTETSASATTK